MCGQGPFFAGVSPALSCLIFLARRMFPTTKHAPLAKRNTGSGVLPGSVYPVTTIPASIPSSMNTIVDLFNEKPPCELWRLTNHDYLHAPASEHEGGLGVGGGGGAGAVAPEMTDFAVL